MMNLSVVIPAYNEEAYLPATLAHVVTALADVTPPSEVVVVDNDSEDETKDVAASLGAKVVLEKVRSISRARNTGAANSTGDVLIFIDADTVVPETLFRRVADVMEDPRCLGGAVSVEYAEVQRNWMRVYLLGWKFWGALFNMKQGAAQFCRNAVFQELRGYDESIFVGEDIEFYWRLSRFARRNNGHLYFIDDPKVTTSARRFNKMSLWKTLVLTHPVFIYFTWRHRVFWKQWYEKAIR